MSEQQPEFEIAHSRRSQIQDEINELYIKLASVEFDSQAPAAAGFELDELVISYTSRITKLEAEIVRL